jgi:membrane-associated phospholipid phosphatase
VTVQTMSVDPTPSTTVPGSPARRDPAAPDRSSAPATERASGVDLVAVAWLVLAIVGLLAFAAATILMLDHVVWPFDRPVLDAVRPWVGDGTIWRVLSESANIPLIVIGVGLMLVLFFTHRRREAVLVALLLIAVTAGSEGVKQLVARPRPEGTDPNIPGVVYSYPSGHVLEALVIFGVIAIHVVRSHVPRILAALVVVLVVVDVLLVGLSRIVLNAHWPSDAVASLLAGAGVLGVYGLMTHGTAWATRRSGR